MTPNIKQTVVIKTDTKLTPKRILHLMCCYSSDLTKTIPKLKANMTPMITNKVENTPKIPFLVSSFGASYPI
jgi:hypothetical protein